MKQDTDRKLEHEEVRDLLANAPDTLVKECCGIAGVPYSAADIKQHNIAMLLTSGGVDRHLAKISELAKASGAAAATAPSVRTEAPPALPGPRDNLPRERDPHFRTLADVSAVEAASLGEQTVSRYAWVGVSNGWADLCWYADNPEQYDWVGLYDSQAKDVNSYLFYSWTKESYTHYVSDQYFVSRLSVRYFRWNAALNSYQEIFRSADLDLSWAVEVEGEMELTFGCWVSPTSKSNTYLNWSRHPSSSSYDWVGLFPNRGIGADGYKTYQWACKDSPYDTGYGIEPGYHARYYIWDDGTKKYVCKRRSVPIGSAYMDLAAIYRFGLLEPTGDRRLMAPGIADGIWDILVDQLVLALKGQPSVFAAGYYPESAWPFSGTNLLWKNLSWEELRVMGGQLLFSQYKQCLMVYYTTYKMGIQIADNDERNAKRHVFWQVSMAQAFGEAFARAIADAHEKGRPGSAADNAADAYNNEMALSYWQKNPTATPSEAADYLWGSQQLQAVQEELLKDEL
jgi:hypothetical protein